MNRKGEQMVLVRYILGAGARPEIIQRGQTYATERIIERLVPVGDTFLSGGTRYYRIIMGHGEWIDIPCSTSSSL